MAVIYKNGVLFEKRERHWDSSHRVFEKKYYYNKEGDMVMAWDYLVDSLFYYDEYGVLRGRFDFGELYRYLWKEYQFTDEDPNIFPEYNDIINAYKANYVDLQYVFDVIEEHKCE